MLETYTHTHISLSFIIGAYDSLLDNSWKSSLGAVLVLDQFSRNMFRGSQKSFASDAKALALAKQAIDSGCYEDAGESKEWFYLPFMHSEDMENQKLCVQYFTTSSWVSEGVKK